MKTTRLSKIAKAGQTGFTLIELMITVAIVGILAAIAYPAYSDYVVRGQVSEGLGLVGGVQTAIEEYYAVNGKFPTISSDIAIAMPTGKYARVNNIQGQGAIIIVYDQPAASSKLQPTAGTSKGVVFVPQDDGNGNVKWLCGVLNLDVKYVPSSCTNNITGLF